MKDVETVVRAENATNRCVTIDVTLDLNNHISNSCKVYYFYIVWIRKVRRFIDIDIVKSIVHALVISRLDYCNSVYIYMLVYRMFFETIEESKSRHSDYLWCTRTQNISSFLKKPLLASNNT